MTHQVRHVRTRAGSQHYDQPIGAVIKPKESTEAKEKWDTRKWQAATAGASFLIVLGEVLMGVSEIALAITVLILVGLNWLIKAATTPHQPKTRRPPARRRTVRRAPTRRRVVRR